MKPIKVTDLETLQLEKERIQLLLEVKEAELKTSGQYIRNNTRKILWAYLNPFKGNSLLETAGEVITPLLKVQSGLSLKEMVVKLISDLLLTYGADAAGRFFKKKRKKKKNKDEEPPETGN